MKMPENKKHENDGFYLIGVLLLIMFAPGLIETALQYFGW
jgi:hypothetical protein